MPAVVKNEIDWDNKQLKVVVDLAQDKAREFGVTSEDISQMMQACFSGAQQAPLQQISLLRPVSFPNATDAKLTVIRDLAEELDAHRKRVLAEHADLTMTGLCNALEKLRAGKALSSQEQDVHERGLVSVMHHLHEDIDLTVADAYGWSADLSDAEILIRLVALNQERVAEEAKGVYHYLRPACQARKKGISIAPEQAALGIETTLPGLGAKKPAWPTDVGLGPYHHRPRHHRQPTCPGNAGLCRHEFQASAQGRRP